MKSKKEIINKLYCWRKNKEFHRKAKNENAFVTSSKVVKVLEWILEIE